MAALAVLHQMGGVQQLVSCIFKLCYFSMISEELIEDFFDHPVDSYYRSIHIVSNLLVSKSVNHTLSCLGTVIKVELYLWSLRPFGQLTLVILHLSK